ncbi:MAG TPA: FAD-binding oxidoreductase [Acidimicrobiia bacterium]
MTDFIVIGGGIAGVSAAACLAPHGSVLLVEQESSLAYHTTGRSAATFITNYGSPGARSLARASKSFLEKPPEGSVDAALLSPRGVIWAARHDQKGDIEAVAEAGRTSGSHPEVLDADRIMEIMPLMDRANLGGGIYEPTARDVDVAGLHQAFVRILRRHDGKIELNTPVTALSRLDNGWTVTTPTGQFHARKVINAAGAWGDVVATMAGIEPIGLQPLRRTAFMVPGSDDYAKYPMVVGIGNDYYFRPDGPQFLCSLSEEKPSEPCDPRPRMEDVALAIDRINEISTLGIRSVNSQWTGLRTFAADREFVIGEEPTAPGFFWLVGQGGSGIMTSPGAGALVASQVLGAPIPTELAAAGVDPEVVSPARFS